MTNLVIKRVALPQSKYPIKAPYAMEPIGVTIHETDNDATAINEIAYMHRNDNYTSFHFAVDNVDIIQGLPLDRNGFHAGDGANGTGNRKTLAIEIAGNYRRTGNVGQPTAWYYDARANAEMLTGYLLYKYNWTEKDIYTHTHWTKKNCPRVILKEGYLPTFKKNAMEWKAKFAGVAETKPTKPTLKPLAEIAKDVLAGLYGNGAERVNRLKALGYDAAVVQAEVNRQLNLKPSTPAPAPNKAKIKAGARYRSKDARYNNILVPSDYIGKEYDYKLNQVKGEDWVYIVPLQSYVAAKDVEVSGAQPKPKQDHPNKTDLQLATEVWQGLHGSGDARKKSLGNRYAAVQALVNEGKGKPAATKPNLNEYGQDIKAGDTIYFSTLYTAVSGGLIYKAINTGRAQYISEDYITTIDVNGVKTRVFKAKVKTVYAKKMGYDNPYELWTNDGKYVFGRTRPINVYRKG